MNERHAPGRERTLFRHMTPLTAFLSSLIPLALVSASRCTHREGLVLEVWGDTSRVMPFLQTIVFAIGICAFLLVYRRFGLIWYMLWTACFLISVFSGLQFVGYCEPMPRHGDSLSLGEAVLLNYLSSIMFGASFPVIRKLGQRWLKARGP
jgi:hypothetical protein